MLDFCIRICNFFSFRVYHDQSAQIYNDSGNMAQFAGLAKLISSKSNVKIVEILWTCKCHTYISCEIVEASKVFFFFLGFLLLIFFPLDVIKICHVTLLSFMKLSKLWNFFCCSCATAMWQFLPLWLVDYEEFCSLLVFPAICIKPHLKLQCALCLFITFLVFLVCLMICFSTKVGSLIFHNIWSSSFLCTNLHGSLAEWRTQRSCTQQLLQTSYYFANLIWIISYAQWHNSQMSFWNSLRLPTKPWKGKQLNSCNKGADIHGGNEQLMMNMLSFTCERSFKLSRVYVAPFIDY